MRTRMEPASTWFKKTVPNLDLELLLGLRIKGSPDSSHLL